MKKKGYTIGLDIGTTSVGWAVTDDDFHLVSKKMPVKDKSGATIKRVRKNLWGVRLFDEAKTAADTRGKRGVRRRLKRRKERLNYLQAIFASEMAKVDENFFIRLDESFFKKEDKSVQNQFRYPLFKNEQEEKAYYSEFPTIYHLRKHLMEQEETDLRKIYLGIHHILKFRGHFVQEGQKINVANIDIQGNLNELFIALNEYFVNKEDELEQERMKEGVKRAKVSFDLLKLPEIEGVLKEKISKSWKVSKISKEVLAEKKDLPIFKAVVGNKIDLAGIFDNPDYAEKVNETIKELSKEVYFSKENFEETFDKLSQLLKEEELEILTLARKCYEAMLLADIMQGETSLSAAMLAKYEAHKLDLEKFKQLIIDHFPEETYFDLFKNKQLAGNYHSYVKGEEKGNKFSHASLEDFYKYVKKVLEQKKDELSDHPVYQEILQKIELETFLQKQRMYKNGAIPYQVHLHELQSIIKKQAKNFPFLAEEVVLIDEEEKHIAISEYKIETLMKFRIPYYVGPLIEAKEGEIGKKATEYSRFAWMQKQPGKQAIGITPWNFHEVVDKDASASEFIERMTGFCSYFPEEPVLPKNSLTYQKFTVFQELSIVGYFDERNKKCYLDGETRRRIFDDLFKKNRTVSASLLRKWLVCNQQTSQAEKEIRLFGLDLKKNGLGSGNFNTKYTTYHDLKNAGISEEQIKQYPDFFEKVVKYQTIFEDKKVLKRRIKLLNEEQHLLSEEQVNDLAKKHYTGWGNLSLKLIDGIQDKEKTVLDYLETQDYNQNLMQLINDENKSFKSQVEQARAGEIQPGQLDYAIVDQLAGSPAIKRGIWQSLQVVDELVSILGKENIKKIVIEMAREQQTSKRTKSRKIKISELHKKVTGDFKNNLEKIDETQNFDNERVFLYYLQNGKCMYSGEKLELSQLSEYEVDHIIPQTYLKDDSFDNKVLVTRNANQQKGGDVPSYQVVGKMKSYWEKLKENNLISAKKFANLTKGKFDDRQLSDFINRQLVETRQITKNVAIILDKFYNDETKDEKEIAIISLKSALTSQFRKGVVYVPNEAFDASRLVSKSNPRLSEIQLHDGFYKVREINDYHHAHDAYLNNVVATYLYETMPDLRSLFVYGEHSREIEKRFLGKYATTRQGQFKQFLTDMQNEYWLRKDNEGNFIDGEILWQRDEVLQTVTKVLDYRNIQITKKLELMVSGGEEKSFYQDSRCRKDKTAIPYKTGWDPAKYGGLKSPRTAYAIPVYNKNKLKLAPVLLIDRSKVETDGKFDSEKFQKQNLTMEVIGKPIKKYQLFELEDGTKRYIASASEIHKGNQMKFSQEHMKFISCCQKYDEMKNRLAFDFVNDNQHLFKEIFIVIQDNIHRYRLIKEGVDVYQKFNNILGNIETLPIQELVDNLINAINITSIGTTNNALGRVRYKGSYLNDIWYSTLIHHSITGLYEAREKLE